MSGARVRCAGAFASPTALPAPPAAAAASRRLSWRRPRRRAPAPAPRRAPAARFRPDDGADGTPAALPDAARYAVDAGRLDCDADENMRGWVKTRGSLVPGEEVVFWWAGDIYGLVEDTKNVHLFGFEGYNIGRMVPVAGGWRLLTREVGIYRHPVTREILKEGSGDWVNPYTGEKDQVVHIWNDPVNQQFLVRTGDDGEMRGGVPTTTSGEDVYWHAEVSLMYPSPLPRSEFPSATRCDMYHSLEMFQFFSKKEGLADSKPTTGCQISWVRVGQWLPWMNMGERPGRMVYHTRGKKLEGGYMDLPESVRTFVEEIHPEYSAAPNEIYGPNETSWTYFKKLIAAKGSPRADGTIAGPEEDTVVRQAEKNGGRVDGESPNIGKVFSLEELQMFDGKNVNEPIYLSLGGKVFDVSSAKRHYRRGETYNCLTGRDATCAFVGGDLSQEGLRKAVPRAGDALDPKQEKDLLKWIEFFAKAYPQVGVLDL